MCVNKQRISNSFSFREKLVGRLKEKIEKQWRKRRREIQVRKWRCTEGNKRSGKSEKAQLEEGKNSGSGKFHQEVSLSFNAVCVYDVCSVMYDDKRGMMEKEPFQKRVRLLMIKKERKGKHRKKVRSPVGRLR